MIAHLVLTVVLSTLASAAIYMAGSPWSKTNSTDKIALSHVKEGNQQTTI